MEVIDSRTEPEREIQNQLRDLELSIPALITQKVDFIQVTVKEDPVPQATAIINCFTPAIRLRPVALPRFSGCQQEFYRWRKDWEALQSQQVSQQVQEKSKRGNDQRLVLDHVQYS